jgi:hypothetical protein
MMLACAANAQWCTQTLTLQPGWNAVYLEVQPEPNECDGLFAHPAIEGVWQWNRRYQLVQFATDPITPLPEPTHWLTWLPPSHPQVFVRNLFRVYGGETCLIRVKADAAPLTLTITGRPVLPRAEWHPGYLQLAGFPVGHDAQPTFAAFFTHSPAFDTSPRGGSFFRIDSTGAEREILQTSRDTIQPGVAYWVRCREPSDFVAPIQVRANVDGQLDFGAVSDEQTLSIRNVSVNQAIQVCIRLVPSGAPPAGATPELAGGVPLSYSRCEVASNRWDWERLETTIRQTLAPGQEWSLRLAARRGAMDDYEPRGTNGAVYASLLEVTDAARSIRYLVPVRALKTAPSVRTLAMPMTERVTAAAGAPAAGPFEGLWVGAAVLDRVNCPTYGVSTPLQTASACPLRVIVHVDYTGTARLLQQVLLAWNEAQSNYVLCADESLIPGEPEEVQRISAVGFPLMDPVTLSGSMSNTLTGTVRVPFEGATNPFRHRYHPVHGDTNAPYRINVTRDVVMVFTNGVTTNNPFWGVSKIGGTYREELSGLRADKIVVQGALSLERVSRIGDVMLKP